MLGHPLFRPTQIFASSKKNHEEGNDINDWFISLVSLSLIVKSHVYCDGLLNKYFYCYLISRNRQFNLKYKRCLVLAVLCIISREISERI